MKFYHWNQFQLANISIDMLTMQAEADLIPQVHTPEPFLPFIRVKIKQTDPHQQADHREMRQPSPNF